MFGILAFIGVAALVRPLVASSTSLTALLALGRYSSIVSIGNTLAVPEGHGPLDPIVEFAHIDEPFGRSESVQYGGGEDGGDVFLLSESAELLLDEQDIVPSCT